MLCSSILLTHPKDISEVVAAGGEDDFVRFDLPPLAAQRHVHKVTVQLQVAQRRHDVRLVVVPLQAEVLRRHVAGCDQIGASCDQFVALFTTCLQFALFGGSLTGLHGLSSRSPSSQVRAPEWPN